MSARGKLWLFAVTVTALSACAVGPMVACAGLRASSDVADGSDAAPQDAPATIDAAETGPAEEEDAPCGKASESCTDDNGYRGSCCSGLGCANPGAESGAPRCCQLNGASYPADGGPGSCCSGVGDAGHCVCHEPGAACWDNAMCCSNLCSGTNGRPGTCLQAPLQSACQQNQYYCSVAPAGQECECAGPPGVTACLGAKCCAIVFGACQAQADCCGGNTCVDNLCLITSGDVLCSQWSTVAQDNESCASGHCDLETGRCCSVAGQSCANSGDCCAVDAGEGYTCVHGLCALPGD